MDTSSPRTVSRLWTLSPLPLWIPTRGTWTGAQPPGDRARDGYAAPGVLERNKGEHHLILRRCPRHRKHTRRRVEMLRFAKQVLCEAKNPGSVINNCGGYVQSAVHEFDGPKSGK